MAFQICPRQRGRTLGERLGQSPGEPVLEDTDTAYRLGVVVLPITPEFGLLRQGEMALKTEDHPLESDDVVRIVCLIPLKVQIDTAAAELGTEIPAWQQLIGTNEHMDAAGQAGQGLQTIQLVSQPEAAGRLRYVLRFINPPCSM